MTDDTKYATRSDLEQLCAQFADAIEHLPLSSMSFDHLEGALQRLEGAVRTAPIVDPSGPHVTLADRRRTTPFDEHGLPIPGRTF